MTGIECAKQAASEGAQLLRARKKEPGQYDCKPIFTGSKRGWFVLDSFSASAIVAVWNALNEENRAKFERLHVVSMAKLAFKFVK